MSNQLDVMTLIDPEVAEALVALDLRLGELSNERLQSIRERLGAVPLPALSDAVERRDHAVPERPPLSVRVHREKHASGRLPCIYWMHCGGLILGRNVGDDPRLQHAADVGATHQQRIRVVDELSAGRIFAYSGRSFLCCTRRRSGHARQQRLRIGIVRRPLPRVR